MRRLSPREVRRFMERMGVSVEPLSEVVEVVFKTPSKNLLIKNPQVSVIKMAGQTMYQVVGDLIEEVGASETKQLTIPEEDVQLVAAQAGVSIESARKALEATKGDLAKAILMLKGGLNRC
ncbi:MAG: nascent polypeptide-associated complex protein [Candidatus Nezhaarchaeales archaeon]